MTDGSVESEVFGIIREILGDNASSLSDATTPAQVDGWDSIKHIMIILEIESRFGTQFSATEIDGLRNVGDLVRLAQRKSGRS